MLKYDAVARPVAVDTVQLKPVNLQQKWEHRAMNIIEQDTLLLGLPQRSFKLASVFV